LLHSSFTNILPNPSSASGAQFQPAAASNISSVFASASAEISSVFANAVFQPINPLAASQVFTTNTKASTAKVSK